MREMSVSEQRYQAVLAVISEGRTVTEVAAGSGCRARRSTRGWPSMRPMGSRVWLTVHIGRRRARIRCRPRLRWCWPRCGGHIHRGGRDGWCSSWTGAVLIRMPSESAVYRALVRLD